MLKSKVSGYEMTRCLNVYCIIFLNIIIGKLMSLYGRNSPSY